MVHGRNPGPCPYLDPDEEKELADFLVSSAECGYGKTRREVLTIVEVALDKKILKGNKISNGWWRRFIERQKSLSLRRGDGTCHLRLSAINEQTLGHYYDLLKDVLTTHDLMDHPERIYNMDETGMPLDPPTPRIVAKRGQKKVRSRTSGKKGQVTVIACGNAVGQHILPLVIFDAAKLNALWTKGEVPGTRYGVSSRGWVEQQLFQGWLVEHFLQYCVSSRPLLLLLDGHSSHFEPETIRIARRKTSSYSVFPHTQHTSYNLLTAHCSVL